MKFTFGLKLKTFFIDVVLFILSYLFVGILFWIPSVHGLYETLEAYIYSQIFIPTATPNEHLLIIDEGETEYDRASYARLSTGLDSLGAKVIAFDVLFAGKRDSAQDAQLVAATRAASDKVIHAIEFVDREIHASIPDRFQLKPAVKPSADRFIQNIYGAVLPTEDLLKVTSHLGAVSASTDVAYRDDQYFPMIIYYNERLYPSLPLMVVMKFLDISKKSFSSFFDDEIELRNGTNSYAIPLDNKRQTLINFISPSDFATKHIPMEKAFEYIEKSDSLFKGKIVLIGNSVDSQEQRPGPHFQKYPSLFIYASLISQILNGENIREGTLESFFVSFLLLIGGIVSLLFLSQQLSHLKKWVFYLVAFISMLLIVIISLRLGVKLYLIVPYLIFCFAYELTKRFYERERRQKFPKPILPLDFYLAISPKRDKGDTYVTTLIASPAGEDCCEIKLSLKEHAVNKIREEIAQNFQLDIKKLKDFGAHLFGSLFHPDIRDQYEKSLGMAYTQNTCLRIKLRIDAPELARYPWEFMYDGDQTHEFLALHRNISITRFLAIQNPVPTVTTHLPLKMLVIISSPTHPDYEKLAVDNEKDLIKQSLNELIKRDLIRLRFLKKATLTELAKELKKKVDIIHFIGHGGYSEPLGGGCLVFESEDNSPELINIDRLSLLLRETPVRLVVLNACQTGNVATSEISLGVAQGLVKIGVPAVIAMQFRIPDSSAIEFSKEFYTTLSETYQVDRAVAEARRKMFINLEGGRIDWGIPVLFMRKDDGVIF
jgi:CHASE2 domain-containing sensor protein